MSCPHLNHNVCNIASKLVGAEVTVNEVYCRFCKSEKLPMQENNTTRILARNFSQEFQLDIRENNPGTELKKILSWFPIPNKKDCGSCQDLERKMNRWGPEGCEKHREYILKHLKTACEERGLPYSRFLVNILLNRAIRKSR